MRVDIKNSDRQIVTLNGVKRIRSGTLADIGNNIGILNGPALDRGDADPDQCDLVATDVDSVGAVGGNLEVGPMGEGSVVGVVPRAVDAIDGRNVFRVAARGITDLIGDTGDVGSDALDAGYIEKVSVPISGSVVGYEALAVAGGQVVEGIFEAAGTLTRGCGT